MKFHVKRCLQELGLMCLEGEPNASHASTMRSRIGQIFLLDGKSSAEVPCFCPRQLYGLDMVAVRQARDHQIGTFHKGILDRNLLSTTQFPVEGVSSNTTVPTPTKVRFQNNMKRLSSVQLSIPQRTIVRMLPYHTRPQPRRVTPS